MIGSADFREVINSLSNGGIQLTWDGVGYYGHDFATRRDAQLPIPVAFPRSSDEVVAIVRVAADAGLPLVASGGRTGLSGAACARDGELVVSLERMSGIAGFDAIDRAVTVQAGVVTQVVQGFAREHGLFYPVDFASRGSSHIGGNIATNAGGIKVLRYGLTRNWVTGLKVVTGTGELLDLNKGLAKNATGYDLRHLFIGSEGTLGIIVEATLQLVDLPRTQQVAVFSLPSLEAVMDVFSRMRRRLTLSAFEFFTDIALRYSVAAGGRRPVDAGSPYYVLAEFDESEAQVAAVFEECHAAGLVCDGVLSQSQAQAAELWRLREGITESIARYQPYKNDIAVRVGQVPAFLSRIDALFANEYPCFEVIWFGHIGDGNLHISILPPEDWSREAFVTECERVTHKLCEVVEEHGGSISAEHGIGLLKRPYLHYSRSPAEIELMRQIKKVFDPAGIMNPGKLFPP